jgi:hypothetical protein
MVMFKAKFRPLAADSPPSRSRVAQRQQQPQTRAQQQQQQPQPQPQQPTVPPIEEERGPQVPIREPEPLHEPERAR